MNRLPVQIRLFALLIGTTLLAGIGGLSASSAPAAEFHCSTEPCLFTLQADGTGKVAHHVIIVKNSVGESLAITCNSLSGQATTSKKTTSTLRFSLLNYSLCTMNGLNLSVNQSNFCEYELDSFGLFSIKGCLPGEGFEFGVPNCLVAIGEQFWASGVTYSNIGSTPVRTITAQITPKKLSAEMAGTKAGCGGFDLTKTPITAEFSTGNAILQAETDGSAIHVDGWWA
jgi:hypothetical protein